MVTKTTKAKKNPGPKKKALNSKKTINAKKATKAFKTKSVGVIPPSSELNTFILIDRSGSMGNKWDTTIESVNEYISSLKRQNVKGTISAAFFDADTINNKLSFDLVLNRQPIDTAVFSSAGFTARGMTPLYDATARAIDLLTADQIGRTALVIVTDGAENFSKEYDRTAITKKLDNFKSHNWEVLFLGADFNTDAQTQLLGVGLNKSLGGSTSTLVSRMATTGQSISNYALTGAAVSYSDADKQAAWAENNVPATLPQLTNSLPRKVMKVKRK